ncbi:hypothetical protein [Thiolapillus sp.]|uniref:hypothetical protein n=1 Tax=Thiolapillus sp. TaxID=2017437 RepID=UPI00263A5031|nr:hypothetical protein [Thiolapillus sp.]
MTRTAGAPIGCQRQSRFWGTGMSQNLSRGRRHAWQGTKCSPAKMASRWPPGRGRSCCVPATPFPRPGKWRQPND